MARTLNPQAHASRRDSFIEAAQALIATKGYEQVSIQDVIDAVGSSKGAFYHYFDSKEALLAACIETMVDAASIAMMPAVNDPERPALDKLVAVFGTLASWKGERKELIIGLLGTWLSDDNSVVRERMRHAVSRRLTPILESVLCEGAAEGAFSIASPRETAAVFVALLTGLNEQATRLALDRYAGTISYEEVKRSFDAFVEAFERILGLSPGQFRLYDETVVEYWFGDPPAAPAGKERS